MRGNFKNSTKFMHFVLLTASHECWKSPFNRLKLKILMFFSTNLFCVWHALHINNIVTRNHFLNSLLCLTISLPLSPSLGRVAGSKKIKTAKFGKICPKAVFIRPNSQK